MNLMNNVAPEVRNKIYLALGVVGLVLGTAQTVMASLGLQDAAWLTASLAAFGYISAAVGFIASSNTTTAKDKELYGEGEPEDVSPEDPAYVENLGDGDDDV